MVLDVSQGNKPDLSDYKPTLTQLCPISELQEVKEIEAFKDLQRISRKEMLEFIIDLHIFYWEDLIKI